uniref:Uncharacterized protein n=1 Tax=Chromera velia CCMP2878 TaxID=1169474 RepID=A0A0G4G049_9ALVE|eukprot:Cvel_527.t1-p1 / transcript=Cvel_527.t1 / gene=Cvel_527 / organism=Chromera_velia_CCMP2878 / gene_product=hypothetical protein / transcript_product=hypothetical protein / location=Cvel_scaffold16:125406-125879(+) / protein_length=158 / sequence_SO=supercontig / SO=protein_coding / is_pseudo=false
MVSGPLSSRWPIFRSQLESLLPCANASSSFSALSKNTHSFLREAESSWLISVFERFLLSQESFEDPEPPTTQRGGEGRERGRRQSAVCAVAETAPSRSGTPVSSLAGSSEVSSVLMAMRSETPSLVLSLFDRFAHVMPSLSLSLEDDPPTTEERSKQE